MTTLRRILGVVGVAVALTACDALKDVMALATALDTQYHVPMNVNINNGSHLVITVVNAPQAEWAEDDRKAFAHEVAAFAKGHYARSASLDDITVVFQSSKSTGPVTVTRGGDSYRWTAAELTGPPADSAASGAVPASR